MEQVVARFLELLQIPVARQECVQLIRSHPDYPALVSVSDALDSLGVDNYVAQFSDEEIDDIRFPYLAQLNRAAFDGELVLLTNAAELAAARANSATWSGIIVQADGLRTPASPEQVARYQQARKLAAVARVAGALALLLLLLPLFYAGSWAGASFYGAALLGLLAGGLLVAKDLGISPQVVEDFCGGGAQAGCDEVLQASPVQLFGFFTLSDAAAAYFLWQVAVLAVAPGLRPLLGLVALLGIPVVAFSVYYQAAVAKAWCRLCLVVNALLLLQAALVGWALAQGGFALPGVSLMGALSSGAALLAFSGLVVLAKQAGLQYKELAESRLALQRAKNSVATFTTLLQQQPQADTRPFGQEMALGTPGAPVEIIMVSNPYCVPCQQQHAVLTQLLALYPEQLHVRFRLTVSHADTGRFPNTTQYLLQHWLSHGWGAPDERQRTARVLHDWYETMDLTRFAASHPADFTADYSLSTQLGTEHYVWVKKNGITRTPTLFINGYRLPAAYKLADLKLMLPSLADFFSQHEATPELLQQA